MEKCDSLRTHIDLQVSQYDIHAPREIKLVLLRKLPSHSDCSDKKGIQLSFRILQEWRPLGRPRRRCEYNIKNDYSK
jgi:hypothetical protein